MSIKTYPPAEELINVRSHALGLLLSAVALVLMLIRAVPTGDGVTLFSAIVFGLSMMALYASSTAYHSATEPARRMRLRILDHATIYILIAGTYTPVMLLGLGGSQGWLVFSITWIIAALGVTLKLFFTGRFEWLSIAMYIGMGWIVVVVAKPLLENVPMEFAAWLVAGGLAYTLGAVIYGIRRIPFNHATFHIFVMVGSFCHFIAVYRYLID